MSKFVLYILAIVSVLSSFIPEATPVTATTTAGESEYVVPPAIYDTSNDGQKAVLAASSNVTRKLFPPTIAVDKATGKRLQNPPYETTLTPEQRARAMAIADAKRQSIVMGRNTNAKSHLRARDMVSWQLLQVCYNVGCEAR